MPEQYGNTWTFAASVAETSLFVRFCPGLWPVLKLTCIPTWQIRAVPNTNSSFHSSQKLYTESIMQSYTVHGQSYLPTALPCQDITSSVLIFVVFHPVICSLGFATRTYDFLGLYVKSSSCDHYFSQLGFAIIWLLFRTLLLLKRVAQSSIYRELYYCTFCSSDEANLYLIYPFHRCLAYSLSYQKLCRSLLIW